MLDADLKANEAIDFRLKSLRIGVICKLDIQKSNNHGIWQRVHMLDTIPHVYCNNFSTCEWLSFWFLSKSKQVETRDPLISFSVCSNYEDF